MASLAGNGFLARFEKLTSVNVFVAAGTIPGQGLHPDLLTHAINLNIMTFQAENFAVFSIQRELRQRVIKRCSMPSLGLMTIGTAPFFDPQFDLPLMRVFVAIGAILIFQVKAGDQPHIFMFDGHMALIAGDG